ncbi:beta-ketoacyl-[acyl-carrier-protein] synthase family protein [Amycolatopsis sp. A1MSW2902]|uniref:beta-ketoacyl-[acyl-carrier-protein] synthase family protein n=1 Tax=Amycolatopsis sp. A1MSW2902 TaxID=687413 RepID=UPI00307ED051
MEAVAITGRGALSPLGVGVSRTVIGVLCNEIAIRPAPWRQGDGRAGLWWGTVPGFEPKEWVDGDVLRGTDLFAQFAVAAAQQAVDEAGLVKPDRRRTAVVHGTSMGGMATLLRAQHALDSAGPEAIDRKAIIKFWPNMAAAQIAMRWQLHGPLLTLAGACAASVDAIGTAARLIADGRADTAITGATEGGFAVPDAEADDGFVPANFHSQARYGLETTEQDRLRAVLPFDRCRSGIATGDGSAMVVLENAALARARGATVFGEVVGYASLSDGHHPSSPHPSGRWEAETMRAALDDAEIGPRDVGAVVAHAAGTQKGDAAEIRAINQVFWGRCDPLPVTSVKGHLGHTGAASGAMSLLMALHALTDGVLPNVAGTDDVDPEADFEVVVGTPRALDAEFVQVNAFGLGGQNASMVIRRAR